MSQSRISSGEDGLAVMSFAEIGQRIGLTRGGAFMAYKRAIRRLREKHVEMEHLRGLATELEKNRPVQVDWFGEGRRESA